MLIRLFSAREGDDYKKVLKGRCVLFAAFIILGLATVTAAVVLTVNQALPAAKDFAVGFYAGAGGGVAVACTVGLISALRLMRNEKKMRAEHIKETDERSKEVTLRAASTTARVLIIAAYVALMISVVLNRTVYYTLLAVIALFFVTFLSARFYYDKKL